MKEVSVTLDTDWAPDFAIDFVAEKLILKSVKATWFITHNSPAIRKLHLNRDLFEVGIHPNFLPGSTQGKTPEEVMKYCLSIAPEAISMRSHSLVQSTPLLKQVATQTSIVTDVSLFLNHGSFLAPIEYRWGKHSLLRIPYCWEDDFEMESDSPIWSLYPFLEREEGLKVVNFHPMHIYLNSKSTEFYERLKSENPRLNELTYVDKRLIHEGSGTQTAFLQLLDKLAFEQCSVRIVDIYRSWWKRQELYRA